LPETGPEKTAPNTGTIADNSICGKNAIVLMIACSQQKALVLESVVCKDVPCRVDFFDQLASRRGTLTNQEMCAGNLKPVEFGKQRRGCLRIRPVVKGQSYSAAVRWQVPNPAAKYVLT
jgi:hypothetical protein